MRVAKNGDLAPKESEFGMLIWNLQPPGTKETMWVSTKHSGFYDVQYVQSKHRCSKSIAAICEIVDTMPWQAAPSLLIICGAFNVVAGLMWGLDRMYYGRVRCLSLFELIAGWSHNPYASFLLYTSYAFSIVAIAACPRRGRMIGFIRPRAILLFLSIYLHSSCSFCYLALGP